MQPVYTPIDPDFFDLFEKEMKKSPARIIYFGFQEEVVLEEASGKIREIADKGNEGHYAVFENGDEVRVDRIITYNGKPGPAYDEYDAYGLACLTCQAGYQG